MWHMNCENEKTHILISVIPVAVHNEYGLGVKRVLTHGNPICHFKMTIDGILECVEAFCRNYVLRQIILVYYVHIYWNNMKSVYAAVFHVHPVECTS